MAAASPDELVLVRAFAAPRELVFTMWTVPAHFARWFGPHTAVVEDCRLDPRPGGVIAFRHRFEDGMVVNVLGAFDEVVAPERLRFTAGFVDAQGRPSGPPMMPDSPLDARLETAVLLRASPVGTEMTVRQRVVPAAAAALPVVREHRRLAALGWEEVLERLAATLADQDPTGG